MLQKSHLLRPNDPNVLSEAVCNMEHAWPIVKDVKHRYDGSSFHRIPCLSTSEYAEGLQVLCSFLVALWHHNDWQSCACFSESPCFFGTELTYVVVLSVWGDKASLWQRIIGSNFVICFLRSVA